MWDQWMRVRGGNVEGGSTQEWEHATDGKMDRWQNRANGRQMGKGKTKVHEK